MKRILFFLCFVGVFTVSQAYSESCLNNILNFDVYPQEFHEQEGFSIDEEIQKKNQIIAKQFSKSGSTQTNLVTYETLNTGVHVHIGWYSDGYIGTALDGPETGKQVVVINNCVIGISYAIQSHNGYFTHTYTWGKVTSYSNKQIVNFN